VVFQGSDRPTGCQFTFTCDGALHRRPSAVGWSQARAVAAAALAGFVEPSVGRATHYHAAWVAPYWSTTLTKVANIGAHIFYVWPQAGEPGATPGAYAGHEPDVSLLKGAVADADAPEETVLTLAVAPTPSEPLPAPRATLSIAPNVRLAQLTLTTTIAPPEFVSATPPTSPVAKLAPSRLPVPKGW